MPETEKMITDAELEKLYASVGPGGETMARTIERTAALETIIRQVRRQLPRLLHPPAAIAVGRCLRPLIQSDVCFALQPDAAASRSTVPGI